MGNTSSKGGMVGSGGGGNAKITKQDRAILDIKLQRDKIKQYQKKVQIVLEREKEMAKQFLIKGEKDRAIAALRRKRYQETILQKTDSQLETLENLITNIEFSKIEQSVMLGLQQGNSVLKEIHSQMTIENVDKLMEETAEAQAYQREIDEALQGKMTAEDEEAIELEMQRLESEATIGTNEPAKKVDLPTVPSTVPVTTSPQEEVQEEQEEPAREALLA